VDVRDEQALVLGQRFLDFGVLRQYREVGHAETFRGLALGDTVVLVAMLDHQPRSFAGDSLTKHVGAWRAARHQNIGSS
jgi:hypothetical protein